MRLLVKVSFIVVALGAMGLGLLALRQQRYEVSNQISRAHNRVVDQERAIWRMQAEVARRTDPRDIRDAAERLHIELVPIQPAGGTQAAAGGSTSVTPPSDPAAGKASPSPAKPADAKPADGKPGAPKAAEPKKKPSTKPARKDAAAPARKDATHGH